MAFRDVDPRINDRRAIGCLQLDVSRSRARTMTVDPVAMATAAKRGEADARALVDSYQCQTACIFTILPALDQEKRDACTKSCVGDDVLARMQRCHETSWLPP